MLARGADGGRMKVFHLLPRDERGWLEPGVVVERLRDAFDRVVADEEEGRAWAAVYVGTYREMRAAGLGPPGAPAVEEVELRWRDAVVVRAYDEAGGAAPLEMLVRREYRLEPRFEAGTHVRRRRRAAEKVAAALGYLVREGSS